MKEQTRTEKRKYVLIDKLECLKYAVDWWSKKLDHLYEDKEIYSKLEFNKEVLRIRDELNKISDKNDETNAELFLLECKSILQC